MPVDNVPPNRRSTLPIYLGDNREPRRPRRPGNLVNQATISTRSITHLVDKLQVDQYTCQPTTPCQIPLVGVTQVDALQWSTSRSWRPPKVGSLSVAHVQVDQARRPAYPLLQVGCTPHTRPRGQLRPSEDGANNNSHCQAPGLQASAKGMAVEGAEDEREADLAATTSMEAGGVEVMAETTRAMDAVAADSTASTTIVTRANISGAIASSSLIDGPLLKAKREEEQKEGVEEAVEAVAVTEEPAAVGKVTLHSLDYWVIDSGATYTMIPRADLLTELEPSPVKHVTSALGQRAEVKGMGKAMFKGADGKIVGLNNGEPEVLGCPTCMQVKFTRFPFSSSEPTAKAPLDEVVMDVVGPLKLGAAGAEYFLTIVDV
ncbi:unnamed protein product [Closterium sp. NIES-53]